MGWLDKYEDGGSFDGLTTKGFNYNGAWGGQFAMGGSLPGSVGFTYARTGAPSNGKNAKKTLASAQYGFNSRQKRGVELMLKDRENAIKEEKELHTTGQIQHPKSLKYQKLAPKMSEARKHVPQGKV
jgi:hypothetical protein